MRFVEYSIQRYNAALREIDRLKQLEFPYPQIRDALVQMELVFQLQKQSLEKIKPTSTPLIAQNACSTSLAHLFNYTPYLGFILRSTNVRNAFEIYAPVLRLARKLLGPSTKLLLSSEWDYSPFVFLPTTELPDFVLIGVPSFESANPLLMSLAGHELGHNVWHQQNLGAKFEAIVLSTVLKNLKGKYWAEFQSYQPNATHANLTIDMFIRPAWMPAQMMAMRQIEEVFCDLMGLRLFSEAYLHAFAYLLSPSLPGERYPYYPSVQARVDYLIKASGIMGVTSPADYVSQFASESAPTSPLTKLLLSVADDAVGQLVDQLIAEAADVSKFKNMPERNPDQVSMIANDFEMVMPTNGKCSLTDALNAGWQCAHADDLWKSVTQIRTDDRRRVLHDLILKSLEVSEYYERIQEP